MKTSIKILLLVVFIAGAVFSVLYYAKTRVSPPSAIETTDQYTPVADSLYKALDAAPDFASATVEYAKTCDMLRQLNRESALDQTSVDQYLSRAANRYAQAIRQYGFRIFAGSEWPESTLKELRSLIAGQKQMKLLNGSPALSETGKSELNAVQKVLADYDAAWNAARNTAFKNVENARKQINTANEYLRLSPINNCTRLHAELEKVTERVANNHYSHIASFVRGDNENINGGTVLGTCYYNWWWEDYDQNKIKPFEKLIADYKNVTFYGKYKKDITTIHNKAGRIESNVYDYLSKDNRVRY